VADRPRAASKRLTRFQMRPWRSAPRGPPAGGQLGPDVQRGAACLPAVAGGAFPAAGLHAVGVDVAGFARAEDDVPGAGPVLLAALEQLAFEQQCRARAVVGDGEAGHLGPLASSVTATSAWVPVLMPSFAGAAGPDGKDAERAERWCRRRRGAVGLFMMTSRIFSSHSALIDFSMHGLNL
jgi:hypothetical protein